MKSKIEWLNFKRRNQSVLIKLFYGQFLSNISCPNPDCQYSTRIFEPFMSVSVPLTLESKRINVKCFFIFYYTSIKPISIDLSFSSECTVMALRNKISQILGIHPFSFIICKLNQKGFLKYYANYSQQLSIISKSNNNSNQIPYFLMQLDPEIFNDSKNNSYKNLKKYQTKDFEKIKKKIKEKTEYLEPLFSNDYIENEKGAPDLENIPISYYQNNIDEESINNKNDKNPPIFGNVIVENYGLNEKYILIPLYINWYNEQNFEKPEFIYLPRILLVKKDITCKDLHKLVFKIFNYAIDAIFEKKKDFKNTFINFSSEMEKDYNKNDTFKFQYQKNYPYRLRIVNINKKKISLKKSINKSIIINDTNNIIKACVICGKINCRNCLLPYSTEKLSYYLEQKYPKNKIGQTVDGTYYFLNDYQRKLIDYQNQDFQLEMTWIEFNKSNLFNILNDYEALNFQPIHKEKEKTIPLIKCFDYFMNGEKLENYE